MSANNSVRAKKKPKKATLIQWDPKDHDAVAAKATAAKIPMTQYVREVALGTHIKVSRSMPLDQQELLARLVGILNNVGAALAAIEEEIAVGDIPFSSVLDPLLVRTFKASEAVALCLRSIQNASEAALSELERP